MFGGTGAATAALFGRFFDSWPHTHAELVAAALDPERALGRPGCGPCPSCGSSTTSRYRREDGLCPQCAEVYRTREISDAALRALPRG